MNTTTESHQSLYMPRSFETTESNKTGSWRYLRPRYEEKTSPCGNACPAGEDIARIEMLTTQASFKEAWETILMENPLPGVCGSVCFHPCVRHCNRGNFDSTIAINRIERFLADTALRNEFKPALTKRPGQSEKIAVIGAGPAGLSAAWFLNMLGYACDIFESRNEAGGILRWGIPEYRLPTALLKAEIKRIEDQGIKIFAGQSVSKERIEEIRKTYQAVFLGCGYSRSTPLGVPGETGETVMDGLAFLQRVRNGEKPSCEGISAIIGGGNTAIDVARTVVRLGGKAVILYRRRREDMPAFDDEVQMAAEEGVELRELLAPAKIDRDGKKLLLTLRKMKIEGQDKDGRGRIVPDGDQTLPLIFDRVFTATGAGTAEAWYDPPSAQKDVMAFSHCTMSIGGGSPCLYGGDLTNSVKNVTQAIASGKQAAIILDTYFRQGVDHIESRLSECMIGSGPSLSMEIYMGGPRSTRSRHIVQYNEINTDYFQFEPRISQPRLLVGERVKTFAEIELKISANLAIREAGRCFNCGICNQCDNCHLFCPDVAALRDSNMENRHIDYDYCKGCGLCAAECPRNAITLGEEGI
jgi:2-oxoacid:acceptor oxidoreductase delta subunit (pyruvate/2-ketoisovalerate family)